MILSIRAVRIVLLVLAVVGAAGLVGSASADSCSSLEGTDYESDCNDLHDHAEDINQSVTDLEELLDDQDGGLSVDGIERGNEKLETLETQLEELNDMHADLYAELLDEDPQLAVQSSDDLEAMVTDVQSAADTVVEQYDEEIESQESSYRSSIWMFFGGSFAVALLAGIGIGTVFPYRRANSVRRDRRLDSSIQYDYRVALVPVGFGIIVFIIGVAILWYANGLQAIGGLI